MKLQQEGFKRYWHPVHQSSIAYKQGTWIGFDDPDGARVKCEYVKKEKLSGAMFWTLVSKSKRIILGFYLSKFKFFKGHGRFQWKIL